MAQANLFQQNTSFQPLAEKLRPRSIDELVGYDSDTLNSSNTKANIRAAKINLLNWLRGKASQSILLWGPPGTGKTTIAQLAAELSNKEFIKLHAFDSGVKDLREIIARAKAIPNSIILFVDEIHNFNKTQQDVLLDAIERGILIFVGATTENPAVSVNRALLSRVIKIELEAHRYTDQQKLITKAIEAMQVSISVYAQDYLIKASYGDARTLLNNFELAANLAKQEKNTVLSDSELQLIKASENENNSTIKNKHKLGDYEFLISLELIKNSLGQTHFSGDANTYYDCVSALQKSMRGSDPDASIYWLARLLHAGAELKQVARRILVTASEDVGLADPQALVVAQAAYDAALTLGMPEARIPLAQAVSYIAMAPKSNLAYKALDRAMMDCRNHPPYPIPAHLTSMHIQSCPAKGDNVGENPFTKYKYPHDYPGAWVEQQYMPDELKHKKYFNERQEKNHNDSDPRNTEKN